MRSILLVCLLVFGFATAHGQEAALHIGKILHVGHVTIAFVEGDDVASREYVTLEEGLRDKSAVIHERNSQTLWIDNLSTHDLFVQSGDLIKGGQQDRMIANDQILDPGDSLKDLVVFCVEEGRSTKRGEEALETFSASDNVAPLPELRAVAKHELTAKLLSPNVGGYTAPDPEQLRMLREFSAMEKQPQPFVQQQDPAQLSVWHYVHELQSSLTRTLHDSVTKNASPTSLQLALEQAAESKRAESALRDILDEDPSDRTIGYLYAVGGTIYGGDLYGSHRLFLSMWPKLARSIVPHALSLGDAKGSVDSPGFEKYLDQAKQGKEAVANSNARTQVHVWETSTSYLFETRDAKDVASGWMHRQYVTK